MDKMCHIFLWKEKQKDEMVEALRAQAESGERNDGQALPVVAALNLPIPL